MPRYECHKKVHALKISSVEILEDGRALISPAEECFLPFETQKEFPFQTGSKDLGYYVIYADGYVSWSPTKAFEEGYTRL